MSDQDKMDFIKKTIMINLDRRSDRCIEFIGRINENRIHFPNFERFSGIDGLELVNRFPKMIDNDMLHYLKTMLMNQIWTPNWEMTEGKESAWRIGEMGCLLSHFKIMKNVVENEELEDNDIVLVMEDDLYFTSCDVVKQFCKIGESLSKMNMEMLDILWLAGRWKDGFVPIDISNENIYKPRDDQLYERYPHIEMNHEEWYRQTTAYMITKRGARRMLDSLRERHFVKPIDHCMMEATNIKQYDWFPHIGYSPKENESDIQKSETITRYHILRLVLFNNYQRLKELYIHSRN